MRCSSSHHGRLGFTLVEMLVVIGVIGAIMGLVMPAIGTIRAQSRSTLCLSNLRQLHTGLTARIALRKDIMPYAAPLPVEPGLPTFVPSLPEVLEPGIPRDCETWMCPGDHTYSSEAIKCSYMYIPGAFMLLQPPSLPPLSLHSERERVARLITQRWANGYLSKFPLLADSAEYHRYGNRQPWNAVFADGSAREVNQNDFDVDPPPDDPPAP